MRDAQLIAAQAVGRVLAGRSLDETLAAAWKTHATLSPQQRAQTQDLAYGTLRHLGRINAVLDALLDKPPRDERLRQLLRVALYQLMHTHAAPYAIVDHAVAACADLRLVPAKGLANAVLRNFLRKRAALETHAQRTDVGRYSYPQWWIDKLRAQYPQHYDAVLEAGNRRAPMTLRVNTRRVSREVYQERLAQEDIAASAAGPQAVVLAKPMPVECVPGFAEGWVSVQDLAAQHAAQLLDLKAGQQVLDACAAPGGKAAHMLEYADVNMVALDNDDARLLRVRSNLDRLGLQARLVCADAGAVDTWWDGVMFDRVLADVPCSASGVVRRHPDIKWLRRASDLHQFATCQQQLLDALWRVVAAGGKLLYSTCSVFREENQNQIARFLERHADAKRIELALSGANIHQEGQILPDALHDGFFYALLQKR